MKKVLAMILALVMALSLVACSNGGTDKPDDNTETKKIKVGFITLHDENSTYDLNFINAAKEACQTLGLVENEDYFIKKNVPEGQECYNAAAELAEQGCNIIFADSFGHESFMIEAAKEFKNVQFCHSTGVRAHTEGLANYHNAFASIYEGRYLAGIAAGLKTETNKLGYVAAKPFAEVISGYTAFYLGAKSVNPDVTMYVNYTNEWSDATKEATNAKALIDQGCDVISQHSDTSAPATTAQNNGVFAVGYNDDMIPVAPDAALVSARVNWGAYYEYALKCLIDGEAIDQDWCGSYAEGACYLSPFNDAIIADGTKEAIEKAAAGLADGSVQVFAGPLHGKDADGNELNLAEGEYYKENEKGSSPTFTYIVDGVTVLS